MPLVTQDLATRRRHEERDGLKEASRVEGMAATVMCRDCESIHKLVSSGFYAWKDRVKV